MGDVSTHIPSPSREVDNLYSSNDVELQPINPAEVKNSITAIKKSMFELNHFSFFSTILFSEYL